MNDDGIRALAAAIVDRAVDDYRNTAKQLYKGGVTRRAAWHRNHIEGMKQAAEDCGIEFGTAAAEKRAIENMKLACQRENYLQSQIDSVRNFLNSGWGNTLSDNAPMIARKLEIERKELEEKWETARF